MAFIKKRIIYLKECFCFSVRVVLKRARFLFPNRPAILSLVHSILLLILSYIWLNQPFDYDAGEENLTLFSFVKDQFEKQSYHFADSDSIVFINIAYDKILVPVNDAIGLPAGKQLITDREKLCKLLMVLSKRNPQKLVFIDIDFDEAYPEDSVLANVMANTKNLLIPTTSNTRFINTHVGMGAVNGKKTLVSGEFFKYPYIFNGEASIPVRFFELLDSGKFEKNRLWYYRNAKLAFNSIVPNFYFKKFPKYNSLLENNYYDLGADILSMTDEDLEQKVSRKIIMVGNLSGYDQHNTFMGEIPGMLILLNAYFNLKYGINEVSIWMILFFFFVYFLLTKVILEDKSLFSFSKLKKWRSRYKVLEFILKTFSLALIFWGLSIFIKLVFDVYLNILLIGIYFAFLDSLNKAIKQLTTKSTITVD